jgi:Na+/proline symporter
MLSIYDYLIIAFYLVFLASVGWVFRRFNRGSNDYFAGGFKMTWWLLGASSFISTFSCWTFTGAANIAYTYGLLVFGVTLIDIVGYIISFVWFAPRFRQLRLVTAMDAIRMRFGRTTEQLFNWFGFIATLGTGAVWLVGLSVILSSAFHLPQIPIILVTGVVVVLIALVGGNWAVAASDFVQLLLLMSVSVVVGVLTLIKVGGISAFINQIPADHWKVFRPLASIQYDWLYLATAVLSTVYQKNNVMLSAKYIGAKDSRHARLSALVPLVGFIVLPIFWFIPPLAAFSLVPDLIHQSTMKIPGEASYVAVCLQVLPRGLLGLMIAAMFSATIASMDVALNKNAGFFVKNFYQPILRKDARDRELFMVGEVATLGFGMLIVGGALLLVAAPNLSLFDAALYMNAYLGVPLAIPLFVGMLMSRTPAWAAWATAGVGVLLTVFFYNVLPTTAAHDWFAPWLGEPVYRYASTNRFVMTNLVCVPLTTLFFIGTSLFYSPRPDEEQTQQVGEFFRRLNTPVDFEKEVGGDNTAAQARLIGIMATIYGSTVLLLTLIPNPIAGRLGILGCAATLLGVGLGLLGYSHWLGRRVHFTTSQTLIDGGSKK